MGEEEHLPSSQEMGVKHPDLAGHLLFETVPGREGLFEPAWWPQRLRYLGTLQPLLLRLIELEGSGTVVRWLLREGRYELVLLLLHTAPGVLGSCSQELKNKLWLLLLREGCAACEEYRQAVDQCHRWVSPFRITLLLYLDRSAPPSPEVLGYLLEKFQLQPCPCRTERYGCLLQHSLRYFPVPATVTLLRHMMRNCRCPDSDPAQACRQRITALQLQTIALRPEPAIAYLAYFLYVHADMLKLEKVSRARVPHRLLQLLYLPLPCPVLQHLVLLNLPYSKIYLPLSDHEGSPLNSYVLRNTMVEAIYPNATTSDHRCGCAIIQTDNCKDEGGFSRPYISEPAVAGTGGQLPPYESEDEQEYVNQFHYYTHLDTQQQGLRGPALVRAWMWMVELGLLRFREPARLPHNIERVARHLRRLDRWPEERKLRLSLLVYQLPGSASRGAEEIWRQARLLLYFNEGWLTQQTEQP